MAADGYLGFFLCSSAPLLNSSFQWRFTTVLHQKWSVLGCLAWPCLLCPSTGIKALGTPLLRTNKRSLVGSLFGVAAWQVENTPVMTPRNLQETPGSEALSWVQGASIMIHSLGLSASPACPETKAFAEKLQTEIEISCSFCFPSGAAEQPLRADKVYPPFPAGS